MSEEKKEEVKEEITAAVLSTARVGAEDLVAFLSTSDFFTAPASIKHHLAYPGGLAEHTLNVLHCAVDLNNKYAVSCDYNSIILTAIAHDFCKISYYIEVHEDPTDAQRKYLVSLLTKAGLELPAKINKAYASVLIDFMLKHYKGDGVIPMYTHNYQVEDLLPLGHGEKSLYVISKFISLTTEEATAIRWHMGAWDLNLASPYQRNAYNDARDMFKLVSILHMADMEATHLVEE